MNCCSNNLGMFPHNKEIDTGILCVIAGTYVINVDSADGNKFAIEQEKEIADKIKFAIGDLNENMEHVFTVTDPNGELIKINDCEFFKLQTYINTRKHECPDNCDDSDNTSYYYH